MLKVIPSIPEHFLQLQMQDAQLFCKDQFDKNPEYAKALCEYGVTRTGIDENGIIIGIMGLTFRHEKCAEGWALFSPYLKKHACSVVKEVKKFLIEQSHVTRIYCTAAVDYPQAHKLLTSFGFKVEGILEKWDALGADHICYTKINNSIDWETR
jgi:RimJ/RimL family protein N-acetyltransferase